MDVLRQVLEERAEILRIAEAHHVTDVRLIGSVARGEAGPDSDVDFVVRPLARATPDHLAAIVADLEALLGRKVDVISEADLRDSTRARLPREAVSL